MATEFHSRKYSYAHLAVLAVLLVFFSPQAEACPKNKPWKSVSRPEKIWSVTHPFKAKKVLNCAQRSRFVTDSLEKAGVLTDGNGGQLDAFRHAYWMALLINSGFDEVAATKIGERHEKGNYINFRKGKLEDSARADSMMCVMDLQNNQLGIVIGQTYIDSDKKLPLIELVIKEIWNGNLSIMSKNEKGEYLDKDGNRIVLSQYKGQWYIPKHIVKSDMIDVPH